MTKKHIPLLIIGFVLLAAATVFAVSKFNSTPKQDISQESSTDDTQASEQTHEHTHGTGTETEVPQVDLTAQTQVSMDIKNYAYSQPNIKIKKGTTVTWTNQDDIGHNVMHHHDEDGKAHTAPTAAEVDPAVLAGPLLAKGESYSFTFNKVGEIHYHCAPHPYMEGEVTVVD